MHGIITYLFGNENHFTEDKPGSSREFVGKLVYLLVFLLFVPGIFSALGLGSVMAPINNVLNTIWGYVPNLVAAAIVLMVGSLIAKLVRQLLVPVFDKLNVNKLQEKAGIEVKNADRLSNTLAYIVYVLILIPTVIMALNVLNITVISVPAVSMLNSVIGFIGCQDQYSCQHVRHIGDDKGAHIGQHIQFQHVQTFHHKEDHDHRVHHAAGHLGQHELLGFLIQQSLQLGIQTGGGDHHDCQLHG
mgnify:CR=1 FL=1